MHGSAPMATAEASLNPQRGATGAWCAISSTIQSMNTRSFALTCRFGGNATDMGIGASVRSSNSGTSAPLATALA